MRKNTKPFLVAKSMLYLNLSKYNTNTIDRFTAGQIAFIGAWTRSDYPSYKTSKVKIIETIKISSEPIQPTSLYNQSNRLHYLYKRFIESVVSNIAMKR